MIDLGRPALHAEGVTVFADHADPHVYHYLPDAPGVRTDGSGRPDVSLVAYRLDDAAAAVLGSGLLSLSVDLAVAEDRLARLRGRIAGRSGVSPITLAPVLAEQSAADLVLLGRTSAEPAGGTDPGAATLPALVLRPVAVGAPLLAGDKAATFAAVLSAEGVALVEGAMRAGGLPLAVGYRLQVTGIRPALRARVTARWADVYHFYENRLHGGKLLLATDIGPTVEQLVHDEVITVEVDELVPVAERSEVDRRTVDEVQRYVVQELFTPTLGQAPPAPDAEADGLAAIGTAIKDVFGVFSLTYSLREIDRNELKTFRYDLATAQAELLTLSPQGSFGSALAGVEVEPLIHQLPPTAPAELRFDVGAARDLAAEDVDRIEVTLRYGDQQRDLLLDRAAPRATASLWYEPALGAEVRWAYRVHFTPASGTADTLASVERSTGERVLRIDPRELYRRVGVRVVAQGVPFDRWPRILVDLRFTHPASGWRWETTVELGGQTVEAAQAVRTAPDAELLIQRRLRYVDLRGEVLERDWDTIPPGVLVVGDPLPDVVDVQLVGSARFGTEVARLIVELRPRDDPGRVDTRVLTAAAPFATWSWAVAAPGPGGTGAPGVTGAPGAPGATGTPGYDYRVTVHTVAGEVREGDWRAGPPGKLVVGEGFAALRDISLYLVGPPPAQRGLLAVKVRFEYADPATGLTAEHEVLVTDVTAPITWRYPVAAPDRTAYTVQVTGVGTDGRLHPAPPLTTSDLIVIAPVPDPVG